MNILFDTSAGDLIINDGVCEGAHFINNVTKQEFVIKAERVVVAVGRVGADWLDDLCRKYGIKRRAGVVDIGVRVECRNEVMEEVNDVLYESKLIGYVPPYNDKVRTFCQNPGGFVSQENYEGGLAVVNGHSFKDKNPKHQRRDFVVAPLPRTFRSADRIRKKGRGTHEYAWQRTNPRATLRRYP